MVVTGPRRGSSASSCEAVARRYSGNYVPGPGDAAIPRVNYWGIWNEPNEGAWLNPQWRGPAAVAS